MRKCAVIFLVATALVAHAQTQNAVPGVPSLGSGQLVAVTPTPTPEPSELATHHIGSSPAELVKFLEQGFPPGTDLSKLPDKPEEKCQLAVDAIVQLAKSRSQEAVPVLIHLAALSLPQGVGSLLEEDLKHTTPQEREAFRAKAMKLFQYNAVNALGLIGQPQALSVVQGVFGAETIPAPKIQYALALAGLGDASGVSFLVEQIQQANRRESAAAAKAFAFITGQDFGYTSQSSIRNRKQLCKKYRDWWRDNSKSFHVDPKAVYARRTAPNTPAAFQPRSVRDLLKLSTYYFDLEDKMATAEAREQLKNGGKAINSELMRIAEDRMEDLDVRMEAINWYFHNNRTESLTFLKKLHHDENPEIADKIKSLIELLEHDSKEPVTTFQQ